VLEEKVENFKKIMKKGTWRERYFVVRSDYFIKYNLGENALCQKILLDAALKDKAKMVRAEAIVTCNQLKITKDGQPIKLKKMPDLNIATKMSQESIKEVIFLIAMETDIPMFHRNRTFTGEEGKKLSVKFKEINPKLYDVMDGYFNSGNIHRNNNKKLQQFLCANLHFISNKRIDKYYLKHPERLKYEDSEYRKETSEKIAQRNSKIDNM